MNLVATRRTPTFQEEFRGQFLKPLANGLTSARNVSKCLLSFLKKLWVVLQVLTGQNLWRVDDPQQVFTGKSGVVKGRVTCECLQSQMFKKLAPGPKGASYTRVITAASPLNVSVRSCLLSGENQWEPFARLLLYGNYTDKMVIYSRTQRFIPFLCSS